MIDELVASVVPSERISFRIFIHEARPADLHGVFVRKILRGDELDASLLPVLLCKNQLS